MEDAAVYRYEIDRNDLIVDVDANWLAFAKENDAADLTRERVVGRSVHVFIAGWVASELYALLFNALRRSRAAATLPFRCDAPSLKRYMQMELSPGEDGHLRLAGRLLRSAAHPRIPLLDAKVRRNGEWLLICSLCRRILLADGSWREIEEALPSPYAEPVDGLPQLSHDVCPSCVFALREAMGND